MHVAASVTVDWDEQLPDDRALAALAEQNRRLLDALQVLEERSTTEEPQHGELQRIHTRLDVLTMLLAEALGAGRREPEPVLLGTDTLILSARTVASPCTVRLSLGLHPLLPLPWRWPVRLEPASDGARALLQPMPESLAQAWERELFLRHRREIGARRQHGG